MAGATGVLENGGVPESGACSERLSRGPFGDDYPEIRRFVLNSIRPLDDGQWTWKFDAGGLKHFIETVVDTETQLDVLRRVACPALFIRAGDSGVMSSDSIDLVTRAAPDARCVEIAGSGHDVHFDQPEQLLRELLAFLEVTEVR